MLNDWPLTAGALAHYLKRTIGRSLILIACLTVVSCGKPTESFRALADDTTNKLVIAHRGASGYLPEGTLASYALAYAMGADYLEMDIVASRDGVLMVSHDLALEGTTDVVDKFPQYRREDGHWYVMDLSAEELSRLNLFERFDGRYDRSAMGFQMATFESVLQLVDNMNRMSGCSVGVYPEIKYPQQHQDAGLPLEEKLLGLLAKYGYTDAASKVFVQSLEPQSLLKIRQTLGSTLPLIQLINDGKTSDKMVTTSGLKAIAEYANGIGPSKTRVMQTKGRLVAEAHDLGLQVHPYTLRSDRVPVTFETFEEELGLLIDSYGVDGVFTDQPDRVIGFLVPDRKSPSGLARRCLP